MKINKLNFNLKQFDFKLYLLVAFFVLLDQFTKFITENINYNIFDFFKIQFSLNSGSAFGIFSGFEFYNLFIILLSLVVLVLVHKNKKYFNSSNFHKWLYIFIFSGVIGNLLDRILLGSVRDFIYLKYFSIFNFADIYLSVAAILIIYIEFIKNKKN